jgi:hypothetical protein
MAAHHVRDLAAPVLSFAARNALVVGVGQGSDQLTLGFAYGLGVDTVVNGLV